LQELTGGKRNSKKAMHQENAKKKKNDFWVKRTAETLSIRNEA
jgi:hypothetical protein